MLQGRSGIRACTGVRAHGLLWWNRLLHDVHVHAILCMYAQAPTCKCDVSALWAAGASGSSTSLQASAGKQSVQAAAAAKAAAAIATLATKRPPLPKSSVEFLNGCKTVQANIEVGV